MNTAMPQTLTISNLIALFLMMSLLSFSLLNIYSGYDGTFILGSELNTNGQIEYLCLGRGCDHI